MSRIPAPSPSCGKAVLKTLMAGICGTDVELLKGYQNFQGVPGHEFVGLVLKAPGRDDLEGQRVVSEINWGCGQCARCRNGDPRHCPERKVIGIKERDGAFAEYLEVPVENIHVLDDSISDTVAVFAEPLAAALEVSQQIHITARSRPAVLGDGKLGLLTALCLRLYCPEVVLLGRHREKLDIAEDQGVHTEIIAGEADQRRLLKSPGRFDMVVEATGSPEGIDLAMDLTRPEGTVVLKTTSHVSSGIDLSRVTVDELRLIGSRCGDFGLSLDFLKKGWIDVSPLIEEVYRFSDFERAFAHASRPGSKKVLISFDQE